MPDLKAASLAPTSNGHGVPSNGQGVPSNGQGVPSNSQGVPSNGHGVPSSAIGVPSNGQGVPSSAIGVPSSAIGVPSNGHGVPSVEELAQKIVDEMMRVSALYDGTWKYVDFENMIFEREVWEDGDPGPEQYYFNCIWSYVGFNDDDDLQTLLEWENDGAEEYVQFENYIKDVFPDLWRDALGSQRDYDLDHH